MPNGTTQFLPCLEPDDPVNPYGAFLGFGNAALWDHLQDAQAETLVSHKTIAKILYSNQSMTSHKVWNPEEIS